VVLGVVAVLTLLGWWAVDRQLEPQRLTTTVLSRLGAALKLDLAFSGTPEYAFRPEPRLRVPNLVVTDPVTGKVVLRAGQLDISLPWATVRGGEPVITRLDLRAPVLDVAGLQRWLAARPKTPFKLPTLSKGAAVHDGTVVGDGWELRKVELDLPYLAPDAPVDLAYSLRVLRGASVVALHGKAHIEHATAASPFAIASGIALARASGPLAGSLAMQGRYAFTDGRFALDADALRIDGASPLPQLTGRAHLETGDALAAEFAGELATWPQDWPALPMPLATAQGPFPLTLAYRGKGDFSDPVAIGLAMAQARLDAQVRVPAMLAWMDAPPASPLPPLTGRLTLPEIDFEGTTLRGVRVEMHEDAAPEPGAGASASAR
jgi:hypothetical protein